MSKSNSVMRFIFSFFLLLSFVACAQTNKGLHQTPQKKSVETPLKIWFKKPTKKQIQSIS